MTSPIRNGSTRFREFLKTVDISLPKGNELRAAEPNDIL